MTEIVATTPLMQQYLDLKAQVPDALLLFRMGDFYELFGDDAVQAARILDITLTSRDKNKENPLPMAGVPHHSVQGYIQKLLDHGLKVAIGEQMVGDEIPPTPGTKTAAGKTIVKREITRVLTPGIQFDREGNQTQYVACAVGQSLACVDVSTGEVRVAENLTASDLSEEISRQPIRHWIRFAPNQATVAHDTDWSSIHGPGVWNEEMPSNALSLEQAQKLLCRQWNVSDLRAFFQTSDTALALGAVVHTLCRSQRVSQLGHLQTPRELREAHSLRYAPPTPEHLDLEDLFSFIQRTRSALGGRRLRQWLWAPLCDPAKIGARQDAVRYFANEGGRKLRIIKPALQEIYDLERILGRLETGLIQPRDTYAMGQTLKAVLSLSAHFRSQTGPDRWEIASDVPALLRQEMEQFQTAIPSLQELSARILLQQKSEPPANTREGGIFARGFHPELDRLKDLDENGTRWLLDFESKEREVTGIGSLKVRYNRVFGYYIEVTTAHLRSVPAHYQRKQTMVGAERFFTDELKKFEEEILTAQSKLRALEEELFRKLCNDIQTLQAQDGRPITRAAQWVATLDALCGLADLAGERGWSFPVVDQSLDLQIEMGRHPLVERASGSRYVPNSMDLSQSRRCLLITGPNMGGKSTVMRQVALIVALGQMGAPIPARQARWGVVSQIFTRIGANDAIAKGQSTFMVEMTELAHILRRADERALIVLDEIGRGTSTYDGISVAWATLEHLCQTVCARTLFATHYHELTRLEGSVPGLVNAHMAVLEKSGELQFLYLLKSGPTNDSFGIQVARMAGVPPQVITRAWSVLKDLEASSNAHENRLELPEDDPQNQLSFFGTTATAAPPIAVEVPVIPPHLEAIQAQITQVNVNAMTPLQALQFVADLQMKARENSGAPAAMSS